MVTGLIASRITGKDDVMTTYQVYANASENGTIRGRLASPISRLLSGIRIFLEAFAEAQDQARAARQRHPFIDS